MVEGNWFGWLVREETGKVAGAEPPAQAGPWTSFVSHRKQVGGLYEEVTHPARLQEESLGGVETEGPGGRSVVRP